MVIIMQKVYKNRNGEKFVFCLFCNCQIEFETDDVMTTIYEDKYLCHADCVDMNEQPDYDID